MRCYPTNQGIGLNKFEVLMPPTISSEPNFRVYAVGGVDTSQRIQLVDPDRVNAPTGSFNPFSAPPGKATPYTGDNLLYVGQLDTVVRVSRVHSIWLDAGAPVSSWKQPILDPSPDRQPSGTEVVLAFRAASGFTGGAPEDSNDQFNARELDPYGEMDARQPLNSTEGGLEWSSSTSIANDFQYIQVRISFINNIKTGLSPELKALALPFEL
jgi:hypothetical protein